MNKQDAVDATMQRIDPNEVTDKVSREQLKSDLARIINKIDEHYYPKVVLPQDVGEELDEWMFDNKDRLVGRIGELIFDMMTHEPKLTNVFCFVGDSEENYFKIIDAYRYGWEAEPEAKWYVQTPKEWWEDSDIPEWMHFDTCRGVCSGFSKLGRTAFTRAEIKQYNLDSDIFTLVPVEEEK